MQYVAKTLAGLEDYLARELKQIGASKLLIDRRAITFEGDLATMYKANLHCRTALRILLPIASFKVANYDDLEAKTKRIDWTQYIAPKQTFAINATVNSENITHSQFATYKVKDAICDFILAKTGKRPNISVSDPDILINLHISHNVCTLSLDSSGECLHHRGYRVGSVEAPISETLAAGLLMMAGWDGQCNLVDPFCGSGTFLIEAAMMALNIPSGIYRKSFAFERWPNFNAELFNELYNDDSNEREFNFHIYGFDKNKNAVQMANNNIKAAGLDKYITVEQRDIADFKCPARPIMLITNPPYGERLMGSSMEEIDQLYEQLGTALKHELMGCRGWVISSNTKSLHRIGLKPSQKLKCLNGDLSCEFWDFEIFAGKRDEYLAQKANKENVEVNDDPDDNFNVQNF